MLKRATSRRRGTQEQIQLNLVPILDTLVALIAFLLATMSFLAIMHIESPFPEASTKDVEQKLKEKPLQLTVSVRDKEVEVWSPFDSIKSQTIPNPEPGKPDTKKLHEALLGVKQQYPQETKVVLVPQGDVNYDTMIAVMDSMREVEAGDPPIFAKNAQTGNDEAVKKLFPEVIFGNLLGGS